MTPKKKLIRRTAILMVMVALWQFGFFTRFNYVTAQIDIWRDTPKIASIGLPYPCGAPCTALYEQYGFQNYSVGCVTTAPQRRGIEAYNTVIKTYLNKRNGNDWEATYQAQLEALILENHQQRQCID